MKQEFNGLQCASIVLLQVILLCRVDWKELGKCQSTSKQLILCACPVCLTILSASIERFFSLMHVSLAPQISSPNYIDYAAYARHCTDFESHDDGISHNSVLSDRGQLYSPANVNSQI